MSCDRRLPGTRPGPPPADRAPHDGGHEPCLLLGTELTVDVEAGHEVFGISAPGPYVERVEALGVSHVPVRALTRSWAPASDLAALRELFTTIRSLDLDVLHTHNPKTGVMGRIAGRLAGVPVVVNTCHGLWARPGGPAGQARLRVRAGGAGCALLRLRAVPERRRPRHPAARPQAWPAPGGGQRGRPRPVRTRTRRGARGCGPSSVWPTTSCSWAPSAAGCARRGWPSSARRPTRWPGRRPSSGWARTTTRMPRRTSRTKAPSASSANAATCRPSTPLWTSSSSPRIGRGSPGRRWRQPPAARRWC